MATFAEALFGLSTDRLREIATTRELDSRRLSLASDKRQLVQFMAGELSKPQSIVRAVLKCNARELRLLQLMIGLDSRSVLPWKALLDAAGGQNLDEHIRPVLTGLENLGLSVRTGESVIVPEAIRHQVPTSLSDRYTVAGCLNNYDAPTVRGIAERLGTGGGTKPENIQAIVRRLLFAEEGTFGEAPLDAEERDVLEYVVQSGGAATAIEVASAVLKSTDDFFRYDWQNRWKSGRARNAIDRLLARGMVFVVSYGYGFNLFLVIPGDLLRALTGEARAEFWTGPAPQPKITETPPRATKRHTTLVRDVAALFGFISTQESVRTNTGYIHKTSLKNLARGLTIQDERYAAFVYALCRQAGLIAPQSEKHVYRTTSKAEAWLASDTLDQIRTLTLAWRNGDFWGEMYDEPLKRGNEYRSQENVTTVRAAALELVATRIDDRFISLDSLTDTLSFRCPLLLAQCTSQGGDIVPSPTDFMRILLGDCLCWLGLAELAWNAADPARPAGSGSPSSLRSVPGVSAGEALPGAGADAYRLTPEGAYLLGIPGAEPPEERPTESVFIVQANAEIFLTPYLDAATLFHLLMITETPAKAASGNVVSLTRESIRRALDQGISPRDILDFLRTRARTGIPQNVEYLINEVGEKHGHIHIGRAQMYLQVDSPIVLKEIQSRKELKGYFVRTLGDTVAILNAAEPDKLLKELRKAGYLPISDDAPKQTSMRFGAVAKKAATGGKLAAPKEPRRAAGAEPAIHWDRIAREDGEDWREHSRSPAFTARPADAIQDKGNIRFLLLDAIRSEACVEVAYQGQGDDAPRVRVIEPVRVMGNFVVAHLPLEAGEVTLNINRISWARPKGEEFAPL
jgi:hypothetical protein